MPRQSTPAKVIAAPPQVPLSAEALVATSLSNIADPAWVRKMVEESVQREVEALSLDTPDTALAKAERDHRKGLIESYEQVTGEDLSADTAARKPALQWLSDHTWLQTNERQLREAKAAIARIDGLEASKKKSWLDGIDETLDLQEQARRDISRMWAYVGRDKEDGSYLKLAGIHITMLDAFASDAPGVIVEAPPQHGKSTTIEAYPLWVWGKNPERRIAIVRLDDEAASDVVSVLRNYVESWEYRALFPHVRILTRIKSTAESDPHGSQQNAKNNSYCFTLARKNWSSTQPSVEAVGVQGRINGKGYDILLIDDPSPPEVVHQTATREALNFKFFNETLERLRNAATARLRLICTPWHKEDVAGTLVTQVEQGKRPGWVVLIDEFRIRTDADGRPISIWPERFTPEYYTLKRENLPSQVDYARLFELRCGEEYTRPVERVQYHPSDLDDPQIDQMQGERREAFFARLRTIADGRRIISIDPSATRNKASTETAMVEFSVMPDWHAYVMEAHFLPGGGSYCMEWLIRRIVGDELYYSRRVIMPYRDVPGDSEDAIDRKRLLSRDKVPAAGKVDVLLWEWQGGISGQVAMTQEFLEKALTEMGVLWSGHAEYERTSGAGGGNGISKESRLRAGASFLHNGLVLFPGRYQWNANFVRTLKDGTRQNGCWQYVCSTRKSIVKLVSQILDFKQNRADGADCVSQFIKHYAADLTPDRMERPQAESSDCRADERLISANESRRRRMFGSDGESSEESQWLNALGV